MLINKRRYKTASIAKTMVIAPMVLWLMMSSQTFASDQNQSVAHMVQNFVHTAQGKQETQRSTFGKHLFTSIQNIFKGNTSSDNTPRTLFASTNNNNISYNDNVAQNIDGSVFFADIKDHIYEQEIAILASHQLFLAQEKFYPHNYVRLADLSKIIVNTYRISVWLDSINTSPEAFVKTAFEEGFLYGVIDEVTPETIEQIVQYRDMQTILENIYTQYPKITTTQNITEEPSEILRKGSMAYYVTRVFDLPLNDQQYENAQFHDIKNNPHYEAMRTLIEANILRTNIDPKQTVSRATFIDQVVKTYALNNRVVLKDNNHDLADINGQDTEDPLIIYAYKQWRLDYILVHTKGQTLLQPDQAITMDEVYEILFAITDRDIITGIIDHNQTMQQDAIASAIVQYFMPQNSVEATEPEKKNNTLVDRVINIFANI